MTTAYLSFVERRLVSLNEILTMKFVILLLVILLIYRFYNIKKQNPNRVDQFPNQPPNKEPQLDDFTDYEEIE